MSLVKLDLSDVYYGRTAVVEDEGKSPPICNLFLNYLVEIWSEIAVLTLNNASKTFTGMPLALKPLLCYWFGNLQEHLACIRPTVIIPKYFLLGDRPTQREESLEKTTG